MPLDSDFFARHPSSETFFNFRLRGKILTDCDPNIFQGLFTCGALAVAAWEIITPNREPLLGLNQRHVVIHRLKKMEHLENFLKRFFFVLFRVLKRGWFYKTI
jgi:hypothetical protein